MAFAELWLPLIGAGVCIAWASGAWYGNSKILAIWLLFAGVVCLLLLATMQWQNVIEKNELDEGQHSSTRANLTASFGAVLLNSPSPGKVTAWIRIKNSGKTPAYKVKGWQKFLRGQTGQNPFSDSGEFENEAIMGPDQEVNFSSTLTVTAAQLSAIKEKTISFYVWGRVEYTDEFKRPHYLAYKGLMNGPPDTVVVDGMRTEGWGFTPTKGGFESN